MIELGHQFAEPIELGRYRRQHPGATWDDDSFRAIRPIVRRQLNLEQEGLCVYCETVLLENEGHVEHIKSKTLNRPLTFVYDNLSHSCNGPDHCGHYKKRKTLPVEPRPGCNRFFAVMILDGKLVAAASVTPAEAQQATETVRILGLNSTSLCRQRKQYAEAIFYLAPADRGAFVATIPFRWALSTL